jgi:hypothetical protein
MSKVIEVKKLTLQRGDILVVQKGFVEVDWPKALAFAAKEAGIDFSVPVIFVDNINDLAVVRQVK